MEGEQNKIEFATEFANRKFKEAGIGNHFPDVLAILQNDFHVSDINVLVAAILHDTLEDTETTYEELEKTFSKDVADMVEEVSHPKNYNAEQKKEYYEKIKHISWGGKMIKLAEFKSHLRKFIGAFTGENDLPKFTHNEYTTFIREFLESCDDSEAKNDVLNLVNELESYISKNK